MFSGNALGKQFSTQSKEGLSNPTVRGGVWLPGSYRLTSGKGALSQPGQRDVCSVPESVVSVVTPKSGIWWFPVCECSFHLPASLTFRGALAFSVLQGTYNQEVLV